MALEDRNALTPRELRDPRAIRALAHPLRLRLLELVTREGTLTSTRASELTGESTGSCSFHLRQLAKYGFIEEADGGYGRERPWRAAHLDSRWSATGADDESMAAASELSSLLLERDLAALQTYERERSTYPQEWQEAGLMSTSMLFLTAEELEELSAEYMDLVRRRLARTDDPSLRPDRARAVRLVCFAVPLPPV
jgi:Helix-turn-helix domain